MSKLLVVVGATGHQGSSVVRFFQQHVPDYRIRGLTRNPSSEAATRLSKSGVDIVKADLNDVESLKGAFQGANAIFAYTDFGGIARSPELIGKIMSGELPPPAGKYGYEGEVKHGKNIADAAATVPELERLIWSTLPDVKKWSKGKYTHVWHFQSKAAVAEYMLDLETLKYKVSLVQMTSFYENLSERTQQWGFVKKPDGEQLWCMPYPISGDFLVPWVDVERDTGAFAKALLDAPGGTHLLGVSEYLTPNQVLELLRKYKGFEIKFQQIPMSTFLQDDAVGFKLMQGQGLEYAVELGFTGGDPSIVTPDELEKQGFQVPRTPMSDFVKRADWSKMT